MTNTYKLTKNDIAAMRDKDLSYIVIKAWNDNIATIVLGYKSQFRGEQITVTSEIDNIPARMPRNAIRCTAYNGWAAYPEWQAIAYSLKAGDEILIEWCKNGNEYTNDTGLIVYKCKINVYRGKRKFAFLFEYRTGPQNSASLVQF